MPATPMKPFTLVYTDHPPATSNGAHRGLPDEEDTDKTRGVSKVADDATVQRSDGPVVEAHRAPQVSTPTSPAAARDMPPQHVTDMEGGSPPRPRRSHRPPTRFGDYDMN